MNYNGKWVYISALYCYPSKKWAAAWAILIDRVISAKEQHQTTVLKTFLLVVLNRCWMNKKFNTLPPKVNIRSHCCQSETLILKVIFKSVEKHFTKIPFFPHYLHLKLTKEQVTNELHESQVAAMILWAHVAAYVWLRNLQPILTGRSSSSSFFPSA